MIAENHRERGTLMLDFRVETFLAVCRHMNFTRAARELSITQPAVSHHIRYLEPAKGASCQLPVASTTSWCDMSSTFRPGSFPGSLYR